MNTQEVKPGAVGVNLSDERVKPRLFKLLEWPGYMGVFYFEPLDNPGAAVPFPITDFWVLVDWLP